MTLALGSAVLGGSADFVGGVLSRRNQTLQVVCQCQMIEFLLVLTFTLIWAPQSIPTAVIAPSVVASLGAAVGLVSLYQALSGGSMSVVAPIASLGVVVPLGLSFLMGERVLPHQAWGILVGFLGTCLVCLGTGRLEVRGRSLLLAGVAGGGFGMTLWFLAIASRVDTVHTLLVFKLASAAFTWMVARRCRGEGHRWVGPGVLGVALLDLGSNIAYMLAATNDQVGIVAVLSSLYPVFTVLLAAVVMRERLVVVQCLGVGGVIAGVSLMSIGQ